MSMKTSAPVEPRTLRLNGNEAFHVWWALCQEIDRIESCAALYFNYGDGMLMRKSLAEFKAVYDVRARLEREPRKSH
jgi:hypothetical protein